MDDQMMMQQDDDVPTVRAAEAEVEAAGGVFDRLQEQLEQAEAALEQARAAQAEAADKAADGETKAMKSVDEASRLILNEQAIVEARRRKRNQALEALHAAKARLRAAQEREHQVLLAEEAGRVLELGEQMALQLDGLADFIGRMERQMRQFQEALGTSPLRGQAHYDVSLRTWVLNALVDRDPMMKDVRPNFGGRVHNFQIEPQDIGKSALAVFGYYPDLPAGGNPELAAPDDPDEPAAGPGEVIRLELVQHHEGVA